MVYYLCQLVNIALEKHGFKVGVNRNSIAAMLGYNGWISWIKFRL